MTSCLAVKGTIPISGNCQIKTLTSARISVVETIRLRLVAIGRWTTLPTIWSSIRAGRDLFIDLTINDDISQGVIQVEDMSFGLSRVEMLTIKYTDGTNVDVDMKSIFDAVTTTPSRIQLTEDTTAFGFIAELA